MQATKSGFFKNHVSEAIKNLEIEIELKGSEQY